MPNNRILPLIRGRAKDLKSLFSAIGIPPGSDIDDLSRTEQLLVAAALGTGVEDLLDTNPFAVELSTTQLPYGLPEGVSGFWGNLGILLPHDPIMRWFAVSTEAIESISSQIDDGGWVAFPTLDNRLVAFHGARIKKVQIVSEAEDGAADWDWDHGAGSTGHSGAFFELLRIVHGSEYEETEVDPRFANFEVSVREFYEKVGSEKVEFILNQTALHFTDADGEIHECNGKLLAEFFFNIMVVGDPSAFIKVASYDNSPTFYPESRLSMVSAPLPLVIGAIEADLVDDFKTAVSESF